MSSRISRIVFGMASSRADGVLGARAESLSGSTPATESLLSERLRYPFLSDERLAQCLQNGEAEALTTLFERHSPLLFAIAKRILRNEAEAEDAVQQVFLDVFRSIHQFDPEKGKFKTWLLLFAYHRSLNRRRHLSTSGFFSTDSLDEKFLEIVPSEARFTSYPSIDAILLTRQILGLLQDRQRRTIELIYYEGLTADEVAARTGETVRVVRHNLYRGLAKLRATLDKRSSSATGDLERKEKRNER